MFSPNVPHNTFVSNRTLYPIFVNYQTIIHALDMKQASIKTLAAIFGATGIALGALGAHALQEILSPSELASFKSGVIYQLIHALALLALLNGEHKALTVRLWTWGTCLFSGSIYLLVIDDLLGISLSFLGPLTPVGGLLFIAGWLSLILLRKTNVDK